MLLARARHTFARHPAAICVPVLSLHLLAGVQTMVFLCLWPSFSNMAFSGDLCALACCMTLLWTACRTSRSGPPPLPHDPHTHLPPPRRTAHAGFHYRAHTSRALHAALPSTLHCPARTTRPHTQHAAHACPAAHAARLLPPFAAAPPLSRLYIQRATPTCPTTADCWSLPWRRYRAHARHHYTCRPAHLDTLAPTTRYRRAGCALRLGCADGCLRIAPPPAPYPSRWPSFIAFSRLSTFHYPSNGAWTHSDQV